MSAYFVHIHQHRDIPFSSPRSLRHEYELYVEAEIEHYKDSIPRGVLLKIGDEAVAVLCSQPQFALTEMLVWQEVDREPREGFAFVIWERRPETAGGRHETAGGRQDPSPGAG